MTLPQTLKRILSALLFLLGLAVCFATSMVAAYQMAKVTPRLEALIAVALLVFFLGVLLTTALAGKLNKTFLNRSAVLTSAALTALFALSLTFALWPKHYPHIVPVARANTRYWDLPTGSRIAYSVYQPPAGVPVKPEPIVFVHGGAGLRAFDSDHDFYRQFTQDGFRVYLFDQAGSGLSDRLPQAADSTVERFVADIDAIRQQIGVDRLILIGHSWGGTLIAHYAAAHPDHVAKLVFHSPGPIWNWSSVPFAYQRTDAKDENGLPPLQIMAAVRLSHASWSAAENVWSQEQSGDWELATMDPGEVVCKGERSKLPVGFSAGTLAGSNIYPRLVVNRELNNKPEMDIRPQLGRLHIPAIALESQCEFVSWSQQLEYKKSIPGLQEFYFADSVHYINFSQPKKLAAVIRSFLLDQPPPFPAYQDDKDPRPFDHSIKP